MFKLTKETEHIFTEKRYKRTEIGLEIDPKAATRLRLFHVVECNYRSPGIMAE